MELKLRVRVLPCVPFFTKSLILIADMKKHKKTLPQIVDELVIAHLSTDMHTPSIRIALVEAIKVGERLGYAKGYNDAKAGCRQEICKCEIASIEEL